MILLCAHTSSDFFVNMSLALGHFVLALGSPGSYTRDFCLWFYYFWYYSWFCFSFAQYSFFFCALCALWHICCVRYNAQACSACAGIYVVRALAAHILVRPMVDFLFYFRATSDSTRANKLSLLRLASSPCFLLCAHWQHIRVCEITAKPIRLRLALSCDFDIFSYFLIAVRLATHRHVRHGISRGA